ncbi:hypothetical protein BRD00_11555 [Halobacteriales archaeon QS_8_69_26]|nr:MAG: hypothetical protein BRD00_11555 [Halobacteriales archaeon QS_8_69_26]
MTDHEPVPVDDWARVRRELAAWCGDRGEFREEEREGVEAATCDFGGSTRFTVTREGRVEGGMPLHEFEGCAEALAFDDDAVRVRTGDGEYVYRRP